MQWSLRGREREGRAPAPKLTQVGEDKVIGSWEGLSGDSEEPFMVLTFRDGKIVDMQGCSSRAEAERFARG